MRSFRVLRQTIPNLVVSQRVLDRMVAAANHYIQDETGEAMIGLIVPGTGTTGVDTIYILDTIAPDDSAVRELHTFQQGDERQDEIIWWLQENWRIYRQRRRDSYGNALQGKWDVPLRYLGDWHKQPGFMIAPSGADQMTALDWVDDPDNGMDFLIAPIVTLGHPPTTVNLQSGANFITVPQDIDSCLRVDFWYIDRDVRLFLPIIPTIYPADQLPGLTAYPWHLVDDARLRLEVGSLRADELFTSVILWDANDQPPLEICFMTARMGSDKVLILITPWNYPAAAPSAHIAPFMGMGADDDMYGVFAEMWAESERVADPPGWTWSPEHLLVDYVHAIETHLGLPARPAQDVPVDEESEAEL